MDLAEGARDRLALRWGRRPALGTVHSEHHERAVFETISPAGPAVVKVDTSLPMHRKEVAVLVAAGAGGLPVPRVLHAEEGPPALLVLQRLEGYTLAAGGGAAWTDAGRHLRRLHDLPPPPETSVTSWSGRPWAEHFRWWADHEIDLLVERAALPPDTLTRLHRVLSGAFGALEEPAPVLLHGDGQADHYLLDRDGARVAGILDFGDAVLGDALYDLAVLTLDHPDRLDDLLTGYGPRPGLKAGVERLLLPYQLVRRLGAARWMSDHGYRDAADLQAAEDLLRGGPRR